MTIATPMKTPVAASERGDSRAMPQTPWPEVQPPAEAGAEADEEAGHDDDGPTRRHLGHGHRKAEQLPEHRCENQVRQ